MEYWAAEAARIPRPPASANASWFAPRKVKGQEGLSRLLGLLLDEGVDASPGVFPPLLHGNASVHHLSLTGYTADTRR